MVEKLVVHEVAGKSISLRAWGMAKQLDAMVDKTLGKRPQSMSRMNLIALAVQMGMDVEKPPRFDVRQELLTIETALDEIRRRTRA